MSARFATGCYLILCTAFPASAAITDADSDNMDDGWETANGLSVGIDDSSLDPDIDDFSNLAEFRLGSDPQDGNSIPALLGDYFQSFEGQAPLFWFSPGNPAWYDWLWNPGESTHANASLRATLVGDEANGEEQVIAIIANFADSFLSFDYKPETGGHQFCDWNFNCWPVGRGPFELRVDGQVVHADNRAEDADWLSLQGVFLPAGEHLVEFVFRNTGGGNLGGTNPDYILLDAVAIKTTAASDTADTDADGVTDYAEVYMHMTDPRDWDTDSDSIDDGYEIAQGSDPLTRDEKADLDGDSFSNFAEYRAGTLAGDSSSVVPPTFITTVDFSQFSGGLPAGWAAQPTASLDDQANGRMPVNGNPENQADWLYDPAPGVSLHREEYSGSFASLWYSFNLPANAVVEMDFRNSDCSGLPSGGHVTPQPRFNDGYNYYSLQTHRWYLDAGSQTIGFAQAFSGYEDFAFSGCTGSPVIDRIEFIADTSVDSDGDGLTDTHESIVGTDSSLVDSDRDTLSDGDEVLIYSTDPNDYDSDGDYALDNEEILVGLNPNAGTGSGYRMSDDDMYPDRLEAKYGTDPFDTDSSPYIPPFMDGQTITFEWPTDPTPWVSEICTGGSYAADCTLETTGQYARLSYEQAYSGNTSLKLTLPDIPDTNRTVRATLMVNLRGKTFMDFKAWRGDQGDDVPLYVKSSVSYPSSLEVVKGPVGEWQTVDDNVTGRSGFWLGAGLQTITFQYEVRGIPNPADCNCVYIDDIRFWIQNDDPPEPPVVSEIDVDPTTPINAIDVDSTGTVKVALLTTRVEAGDAIDFNATHVQGSTVRFGPAAAAAVDSNGSYDDVDNDGDVDMLLEFPIQSSGFVCEETTAANISGEMITEQQFSGMDMVTTSECTSGCHP